MDLVNVIMYILLFGFTLLVYNIEKRDWTCTNSYDLAEKCKVGDGMPYHGSKPEEGDDHRTLVKKINIAAGAEPNSIKWRRALTLAVSICLVLFLLVITPGNLPQWTQMYICVIIATFILYFSFNYYSYHRFKTPKEYIEKSTEMLMCR